MEFFLMDVNGKAGSFYRDYGSDRGKKDVQILQNCFQAGTVFFTEDLIQRQMNDFMVLGNTGGLSGSGLPLRVPSEAVPS